MSRVILQCRPSSHLFNDREISMTAPVKIGRAVAGCKPLADNGYFNCKVLSRNHAVLWYENGKFFLQDTQSSNGTFVNNQKLPTGAVPSSPGSQSSQGTLKEDPRNDGRKEIWSGDVVQFGVEVLEQAKKGAQPVTHGCIVANLKLFHPDGTEAKALPSKFTIVQNPSEGAKRDDDFPVLHGEAPKLSMQEIYELQTVLQEAHQREHVLESKLSALNKILAAMEQKDSWNATFQEDLLLSKIQYLQGRLHFYESQSEERDTTSSKSGVADLTSPQKYAITDGNHEESGKTFLNQVRSASFISDDYKLSLMAEWRNMLDERSTFELVAKDALQRALEEKLDIVKSLAVTEERLLQAQNECDDLSSLCQSTQKDLLQLVDKFTVQSQNLDDLTQSYQESERVKIECLDSLRTDKQQLEEKISLLQQQLEGRLDLCEKLRRQNEKLLRTVEKSDGGENINGNFHVEDAADPLADEEHDGQEDVESGSDEEILPPYPELQFPDAVFQSSPLKDHSGDNIFQGKDVAQLIKDMQDMESDEDDDENGDGEASNPSNETPSDRDFSTQVRNGSPGEMDFLRRSCFTSEMYDLDDSSARISFEILPSVDMLRNGRKPCQIQETVRAPRSEDVEDNVTCGFEQNREGNGQLNDLVKKLQLELAAERENIRLLTAVQRRPSDSFEKGDSATFEDPLPGSSGRKKPNEAGNGIEKVAFERSGEMDERRVRLVNALEQLSELTESSRSASSVFQSASFSVLWTSLDQVAISVLLLLVVWLGSLTFFAL